jgi:predicted phosphodiesterase
MKPGRSCPLGYRYLPADFARPADFSAGTLYVIGGLYGNLPALDTILAMAARESAMLVFNGDFNWFNIDDAGFCAINNEVLRHHALRGNVETELASDDDAAGCGCAYPDHVSDAEVARSNSIMTTLRATARHDASLRQRLAALPMNRVAEIAGLRVAIVHGDLESLAGWGLAADTLTFAENRKIVQQQLVVTRCAIAASSHTCLPVALRVDPGLIINNGAAGMPNFRDTRHGVITRIAATPSPHLALYGTRMGKAYVDALPVRYDHERWQREFLANWPQGSPAFESYHRRIIRGPSFTIDDANRLHGVLLS